MEGVTNQHRTAALYCRISQDRDNDLLGVKRQEQACRDLARARGWKVFEVFVDDDVSAFSGKRRPGYEAMVEAVKAGLVDAVVTWAPDRLTRHPRELEDLIDLLDAHKLAVATHLAGDYDLSTSGGRMVARTVGAVARHESEVKSERVKLKMSQIAQAGRYLGGKRPYGYERDGMTVRPAEAKQVRFMVELVREGLGLRRVEQELNARGVKSAEGREWSYSAVRGILTNPRIAGLSHHNGEVLGPAAWPAIIDRGTWEELQAILVDPRRKHRPSARYLLTGLVFSPDGMKLVGGRGSQKKGETGPVRRIYHVSAERKKASNGRWLSIDAEGLEKVVVEYVLQFTDRAALPLAKAPPAVPSELGKLEAQLEKLALERANGDITFREWQVARTRLMERIEAARAKAPESPRVPAGISAALGTRGGLRKAWPDLSDHQKRQALSAVLDKVVVHPATSGRVFDPGRIEPHLRLHFSADGAR